MTDKKGTGKSDPKPGEKRPHATIDLRATEVRGKNVKPKAVTAQKPQAAKSATPSSQSTKSARDSTTTATSPSKPAPSKSQVSNLGTETSTKPGEPKDAANPKKRETNPSVSGASQQSDRDGGGFLSHMAAGIVGAVVAFIGATSLLPLLDSNRLFSSSGGANSTIEQRLEALESAATSSSASALPIEIADKLAAAENQFAKITQLSSELENLRTQHTALTNQTDKLVKTIETGTAPESAEGRLAALEQQLKTLAAAAGTEGDSSALPQLTAITGRLSDLEGTLNTQMTALRENIAKDVENRISAAAEASVAAKSGTERIDRELTSVKTDTARVVQQFEILKTDSKRTTDVLRTLQDETGTLKNNLNKLTTELATQFSKAAKPSDITSAVGELKNQLAGVENKIARVIASEENRSQNAQRIVLALELASLKRALTRGQPYSSELESVKTAAPGAVDVSSLEKHKDSGIPTLAKLQSGFRGLAHKIIDAETTPTDSSLVDRLLAGAKSVVRIRKVNVDADEAGVEAIVARMDGALQDGALELVIREADKLSPQAATPAQDWLDQARSLAEVNASITKIEQQLKQSLGGPDSNSDPMPSDAPPSQQSQ